MFMSASDRKKNGKSHIYHRVMEKRCVAEGRWIQRQVIYLGELTSAQQESWRRALQVFDPQRGQMQTRAVIYGYPFHHHHAAYCTHIPMPSKPLRRIKCEPRSDFIGVDFGIS
jgi:hypothetical protein